MTRPTTASCSPSASASEPGLAAALRRLTPATAGVVAAVVVLLVVLAANRWVFTQPVHEHSDYAANSLLIERAERLQLATGQYSRFGWYHPGPAMLYAQAAGERLFHDWVPLAESPYGGQVLGVVAVDAALAGLVVATVAAWHRSRLAAVAAAAVILGFGAANAGVLTNGWAPFTWPLQALLLVVASAAVLAGRGDLRRLWLVVLAGGLLVHGHLGLAAVALPVVVAVTVAALARLARPGRAWASGEGRGAVATLAVAGVFAAPLVLHVLVSWPGELDGWWRQVRSGAGGDHGPGEALGFVGRFWLRGLGSGRTAWAVALAAAAVVAAAVDRDDRRRAATRAVLGVTAALAVLGWLYAWRAVDDLSLEYLGVWLIALPWALLVVVAARVADEAAARGPALAAAGAAAAVAGVVAVAALGPGWRDPYRGQPELPAVEAALASAGALAPGSALLIDFDPPSWVDALGLLVAVERDGHRACLADPQWVYMVGGPYICDEDDRAGGVGVRLAPPGSSAEDDRGAVVVHAGPAITAQLVDPATLPGPDR